MLGNIVLVRQERPHTAQLEDAFVAAHRGKLVHGHELFATMSSDEFKNGQKIPLLFTKEGNTTLFKS